MIEVIKNTISDAKEELRQNYKAEVKGIFGSYARGDYNADSDLDLLVDFEVGASLLDLVGVQLYFEEKLDCKVDVVSRRALREEIRDTVLKEMIYL